MLIETLKKGALIGSLVATGALVACNSDDTPTDAGVNDDATVRADAAAGNPDAAGGNPDATSGQFTRPAGSIAVNFTIDDSANKVYRASDGLAWKGSFGYNATTRIAEKNGWTGPFAALYDDGPWDQGGHEPAGATAGDNKWGIAMFVIPSATDAIAFEYGAIRGSVDGSDGEWIWQGPNGTFNVPAAATTDITATGLTLPAFGTTDLRFTIRTSSLAPEFAGFDPANGVRVKSSGWGWSEQDMVDDGTKGDVTAGDRVFTFQVGENVGEGKPLGRLSGLFKTGDEAQFVFVLGGVEYKVAGAPPTTGVGAAVKATGTSTWTPVAVTNKPDGDRNTFVVIP